MSFPRVLHFSPFLALSGANRSLLTLAKAQQQGVQTYAVLFAEGELSKALRDLGVVVRCAFSSEREVSRRRAVRWTKMTHAIRRAVSEHDIELLHCHSAMGLRYAWPAVRGTGARLLAHQRDTYRDNYFHLGLGAADHIISNSQWVRGSLPVSWHQRTSVVYNAVEVPVAPEEPRSPLVIGMAARCDAAKGAALFLEACVRLLERHDFEVELWGIEDCRFGRQLTARVARIAEPARRRIRLRPFLSEMDPFYSRAHIVVVPSLYPEPFGRVAIEGMAHARAVVVAGHGGLFEIVEHERSGLVFAPASVESLTAQLERLILDPELRERLARAGHHEVEERFNPSRHAREVLEAYRRTLARSSFR